MDRFTRFFPDDETLQDWCGAWSDGLAGLSGEQIKYGLGKVSKENPWPPTIAEFRQACEAAPKPHLPRLKEPKHGVTDFASRQMGLIRTMLENPKPAGIWWKKEVLEKAKRGESVSPAALALATEGRQE